MWLPSNSRKMQMELEDSFWHMQCSSFSCKLHKHTPFNTAQTQYSNRHGLNTVLWWALTRSNLLFLSREVCKSVPSSRSRRHSSPQESCAVGLLLRQGLSLCRCSSSRDSTCRRLRGFTSSTTERRKLMRRSQRIFKFNCSCVKLSCVMLLNSTTCWPT